MHAAAAAQKFQHVDPQTIVDNDHVWNEFKKTKGFLRIMKDFERAKVLRVRRLLCPLPMARFA